MNDRKLISNGETTMSDQRFKQWIAEKGFDENWEYRQQPVVSAEEEAYAQGAEDAWNAYAHIAHAVNSELVKALREAVEAVQAFNSLRIDSPGYSRRHFNAIMTHVPRASNWSAILDKYDGESE